MGSSTCSQTWGRHDELDQDVVEAGQEPTAEREVDVGVVDRGDLAEEAPQAAAVEGRHPPEQVEREGDVGGGERSAVGPVHPGPGGDPQHPVVVAPGVGSG
jgi:hypothetical protein